MLTLKMKILFDDVLYAGTQYSSNLDIFVGILNGHVLFSTFNLENGCQGHIFSRSKYKKHTVGDKLKRLSYRTVVALVPCGAGPLVKPVKVV
jgi:hypothetical protein